LRKTENQRFRDLEGFVSGTRSWFVFGEKFVAYERNEKY